MFARIRHKFWVHARCFCQISPRNDSLYSLGEKYYISLAPIWILTWKISSASKILLLFSLTLTSAPSLPFLTLEGEWCFVVCSSRPALNCRYIKRCRYKPGVSRRKCTVQMKDLSNYSTTDGNRQHTEMHSNPYRCTFMHSNICTCMVKDKPSAWPSLWSDVTCSESDNCHMTSPSHLSVLEFGEHSALVFLLKGSFHWLWRAWITLQTWLGIFGLQMSWKQAMLNGRRAVLNSVSYAPRHLSRRGSPVHQFLIVSSSNQMSSREMREPASWAPALSPDWDLLQHTTQQFN